MEFLQLSTLVENYPFNVKIRDISFIFDQKKVLRYFCESDMAILQLEGDPFSRVQNINNTKDPNIDISIHITYPL